MKLTRIKKGARGLGHSIDGVNYNIHLGPNTLSGDETGSLPKWNGNDLYPTVSLSSTDIDLSAQINGTRTTFLSPTAIDENVMLYYNGQRLFKNIHYTVSVNTREITIVTAPDVGDELIASIITLKLNI